MTSAMPLRIVVSVALALAVTLLWAQAHGQTPDDEVLIHAKQLHRQGVKVLRAGDPERALDYFRKSRALYPSSHNVTNQAICLHRLERYDEALEVYEELLAKYAEGLAPADRALIGPAMATLRKKVGNLWVSANVRGAVLVDGRERAKLPLDSPIRVLAGDRVVRVLKPGYGTFRATVKIAARAKVDVDANLEPLADVGSLRVEEVGDQAVDVFIDGARVGTTPWEGPLSAGAHLVWIRQGELGSAPRPATVLQGQTTLVRLKPAPLGPEVRLRAEPPTAMLQIDGGLTVEGAWAGRLPAGHHVVVAYEDGYHSRTVHFSSQLHGRPVQQIVALTLDPEHPRWPATHIGDFWLAAFAGYAGGPRSGSGAEHDCPSRCDNDPRAHGVMVGGRGGFRFDLGISLELAGGYLWFGSTIDRSLRSAFGPDDQYTVRYEIEDALAVRGPFVAPGLSWRLPLPGRFVLVTRTTVGIFFAVASDDVSGTARTGGEPVPVVLGEQDPQRKVTFFVMPELGATTRVGPFDLGLSLGAAFFPTLGPQLSNRPFGAAVDRDPSRPGAVGNAQRTDAIADERAWGLMTLWVPQVSAAYTF